jgi:hypothetical protein
VHAGVDGIGLGCGIHRPGRAPGQPGALDAERIREAIRARNEASDSVEKNGGARG